MTFGTIDKRSIPEQIIASLLDMMKNKELLPGDKLPPERKLADSLNVSRPSLREALRALSIMNVIEIQQGGGAYITALDPGALVDHLDFVLSLDSSTVLQLFEARRLLEVGIIELAVERITDADIVALDITLEKNIEFLDRPEKFLDIDIRLHDQIAATSRNPMLIRMLTSVSHLSRTGRLLTVRVDVMRQQTIVDHRRIVDALKVRNREEARQAMIDHLNNSEQELCEVIASHDLADTTD